MSHDMFCANCGKPVSVISSCKPDGSVYCSLECDNIQIRLAEIDAQQAPPEFKEGQKAFLEGKGRHENPYSNRSLSCMLGMDGLWDTGWKSERDRN